MRELVEIDRSVAAAMADFPLGDFELQFISVGELFY